MISRDSLKAHKNRQNVVMNSEMIITGQSKQMGMHVRMLVLPEHAP